MGAYRTVPFLTSNPYRHCVLGYRCDSVGYSRRPGDIVAVSRVAGLNATLAKLDVNYSMTPQNARGPSAIDGGVLITTRPGDTITTQESLAPKFRVTRNS